jgi:hypothetical protein
MALLLAAVVAGCGGGNGVPGAGSGPAQTGSTCSGASCVNLGTAANYVVFANTGIHTDAGASVIIGNIATGPGVTSTAITGFALNLPAASPFSTTPQVSGKVYAYDYAPPTPTEVNTASNAMGTAYTAAAGKTAVPGTCPGAGSFDGGVVPSLAPGVYTCSGASGNVTIPNDFTLNGTSTDVWVFQIAGTLDETSAKHVLLTGGALPQNVFWQVAGAATIGSTAHFEGILLDQTAITFGHLSSVKGRLMAQTAVTLDATTVTQP